MVDRKFHLSRRDFLKSGALVFTSTALFGLSKASDLSKLFQTASKRIYLAPDDHTDYFWSAGENEYRQGFIRMIDYYLDLADSTEENRDEHQSRWNCDGSYWLWVYEKNKSAPEYKRLIERVRDGHITFPLNALVVCLGGAPAEAVLRGMYYAGKVERRENLRFSIAISMENQTLPFGLASLWAGSGARYSWKGICGCDTQVPAAWDREHDIYWWVGDDGSRILMKWNSMIQGSQYPGGYAEARFPAGVVDFVDGSPDFIARYPYPVIGCFGYGWDDFETKTDEFVIAAKEKTNSDRLVIVSNQEDFFTDFEENFGDSLPTVSSSFGNEWDLYCAALAETSASVKRSVEKLRTAEAIASLVILEQPDLMQQRLEARDNAWMNLGLFWEHNFGMVGPPSGLIDERVAWQKRLEQEIRAYVDNLLTDSVASLGGMIRKPSSNATFFVFNPLNWIRSDYADIPLDKADSVHAIDLTTDLEIPSQTIVLDGKIFLRIWASDIPPLGYKTFEIIPGEGQKFPEAAKVNGNNFENQFHQLIVADRGAITSWVDFTKDERQFAQNINGRAINDLGNSSGSLRVENSGPVSVTLLATADQPIRHTSRITLFHDSPRIDIQNSINENFDDTVTWGFGFNLRDPDIWHEEVGAIIRAKLTTQGGHYSARQENSRYDWLTLNHFVDISDSQTGIILSNADCYFMQIGNSTPSELDVSTPQISVLAGGRVVSGNNGLPNQGNDNLFLQRFALRSHDKYDPVESMKFSLEHQNPFVVGSITGGDVYPETTFSIINIDNPNIILWVLKPAEDGLASGIIVRLWNVSQTQETFSLGFNAMQIDKAQYLSHIETPLDIAVVKEGKLVDIIEKGQMRTYALFPGGMRQDFDTETPTPIPTATPAMMPGTGIPTDTISPVPTATQDVTPDPNGKGCLWALIDFIREIFS